MWYIARTKPRFEKKAELLLNALNLEGEATPIIADALVLKVKRKWSDRIKEVEIPSISGYIFIRFAEHLTDSDKNRLLVKIHYTPGILHLLTHPGQSPFSLQGLATITQHELDIFYAAAQASGNSITPANLSDEEITTGSLVRICKGPLARLNATFIVEDIHKDTPTLFIGEGIFKNARFTVSKDILELVE